MIPAEECFSTRSGILYESIVRGADGVPLETFAKVASDSVVAIFAVSSVSRLVLSALSVLVLVRYRAAVGLMLLVTVVDFLGRELALSFYHLERVGAPVGPTVNRVLMAMAAIGLVLVVARSKPDP
jgi:hypothetical protein